MILAVVVGSGLAAAAFLGLASIVDDYAGDRAPVLPRARVKRR